MAYVLKFGAHYEASSVWYYYVPHNEFLQISRSHLNIQIGSRTLPPISIACVTRQIVHAYHVVLNMTTSMTDQSTTCMNQIIVTKLLL